MMQDDNSIDKINIMIDSDDEEQYDNVVSNKCHRYTDNKDVQPTQSNNACHETPDLDKFKSLRNQEYSQEKVLSDIKLETQDQETSSGCRLQTNTPTLEPPISRQHKDSNRCRESGNHKKVITIPSPTFQTLQESDKVQDPFNLSDESIELDSIKPPNVNALCLNGSLPHEPKIRPAVRSSRYKSSQASANSHSLSRDLRESMASVSSSGIRRSNRHNMR
mmetsp:Transcript_13338/g.28842  ORF Transcript_13338/g.28842 Transcript_13338/m.28842 type:complete len:220 (-) Transcript_13338:332-991(-)